VLTSLGKRFARVYKGGEATAEPPPVPTEAAVPKIEPPIVKTEPPPIPT